MTPSTPAQRAAIAITCNRLGLDKEAKAELVSQYSEGRTESTTALSMEEARQLLLHLAPDGNNPAPGKTKTNGGARMRRNIIAMAHEMGWKLETGKADMERVNAWCLKQFGKKKLNDYTCEELPKLVFAFKQVYKHFLNSI